MAEHVDVGCAECGVEFCVPAHLHRQYRRNHTTFYCPNGHQNYYPGQTEEEKKIATLEATVERFREQRNEAWADREEALHEAKVCPFECGFVVKRKQLPESKREAMREHLLLAHGARGLSRELAAGEAQRELEGRAS